MAAQVKLQWTHVAVEGVTQQVERKIDDGEWVGMFGEGVILQNPEVENGWTISDGDLSTDVPFTAAYRVMVNNGTYSLPSNVVELTINPAPVAVTDLTGEVEVL